MREWHQTMTIFSLMESSLPVMVLAGIGSHSIRVPSLSRTAQCSLLHLAGHCHPPSLSRATPILLIVSVYQKCSVLLPLAWEPRFCKGCFQPLPTHTIQFGRVFKHPTSLVLSGIWRSATWTLAFAAYIVPFCLCQVKAHKPPPPLRFLLAVVETL